MKKWWFEKKATFPVEIFFNLCFLILSRMIVINLQLQRAPQDLLKLIVQVKKTFFWNKWVQRKIFERKPSSGWKKNGFGLLFLLLPVMLLKTQLFEKELFWPFFLVLCSIENLSELFITAHIVFWPFLCNI